MKLENMENKITAEDMIERLNLENNKTNRKIIIALVIIILLLGAGAYVAITHYMQDAAEQKALGEAAQSKLIVTENKLGQETASRQAYETADNATFLALKNMDAETKKLQDLVRSYKKELKKGGSATVVTTETAVSETAVTTVIEDSTGCNPTYQVDIDDTLVDPWLAYKIVANRDSINFNFVLKNEFTVVVGQKQQKGFKGWFKDPKPFVDITNLNPYTKTKELRTYTVAVPKQKRLGIGVSAGYGLHMGSGGVSHGLNISVGLNYNLILIK